MNFNRILHIFIIVVLFYVILQQRTLMNMALYNYNLNMRVISDLYDIIDNGSKLYTLHDLKPTKITVTSYSPRKCETDDTPFLAAGGPVASGTIAISKDLELELGWKMHGYVFIPGHGTFRINDRMNERWKRRVDVFHFDTSIAKGIKKKTIVYYLGEI